jgi:hypothetical protein
MTGLRELLEQVADGPAPPSPLSAAEVFSAGRRRLRRGRRMALGGAVAALALAGAGAAVVVPTATSGPSVHLNVVYAFNYTGDVDIRGWQILDPETGRYRSVNVSRVSPPTADLRYAAVAPPLSEKVGDEWLPAKKIGRYESATGNIRWYDIPVVPYYELSISPDGSRAAVVEQGKLVGVNLASGTVKSVDLPDGIHEATGIFNDPVWRPDGRHILVSNYIFDLDGRVVAVQQVPAGTQVRAPRPDRPGLLVRTSNRVEPQVGVTDERGRLVRRTADRWPGCPGCSGTSWAAWSARTGEILLAAYSQTLSETWIYATDVGGGEKKPATNRLVHRTGPNVMDFVLGSLTDPADAPGAETF